MHLVVHAPLHDHRLQDQQEVPQLHVHGDHRTDQLVLADGEEAGEEGRDRRGEQRAEAGRRPIERNREPVQDKRPRRQPLGVQCHQGGDLVGRIGRRQRTLRLQAQIVQNQNQLD